MSDSLVATWNALSPDKRKAFAALMRKKGINVYAQLPVSQVERTGVLPLSYAQERMWFLAQLEPDSAAYSITGGFELRGSLDIDAVQQAVDALVQRHEPLRTAFVVNDGRAQQLIVDDARCNVVQHDLRARPQDLDALVEEHASRPFDLTQAPLFRVSLAVLGDERHALLFALHHIISDGWSLDLLLAEFSELYESSLRKRPSHLPQLPLQYLDYAAWQRAWLSAGELERQLSYWKEYLGAEHSVLELPTKARTGVEATRGAVYSFQIDADTSALAQRVAQAENATLFMLLLAAFEVLLYRWTGQAEFRVGVPVTNRPRTEFEGLVGLFVNTHVHRVALSGGDSLRSLLARVRQGALGAQAHAELPFERLVEALAPERALGVNPLFQVMYNHEATAVRRTVASSGRLQITPLRAAGQAAQLDLALDTASNDVAPEIDAAFNYAADLFEPGAIAALAASYVQLLQQLVRAPDQPIASLSFLEPGEELSLLAADRTAAATLAHTRRGPNTEALLPAGRTAAVSFVHARFAEQARVRPDATALLGENGEVLSYAKLDRQANQWAQRLRACGVREESRVGLALSRSPRMIVGALAVWKAGAAFVALDPEQPVARLRELLVEAGVQVLMTERSQPTAAELGAQQVLCLDTDDISSEPVQPPATKLSADNLAYLVYTSGSTGRPKAVAVAHAALAQHIDAVGGAYNMTADDCVVQFAPMIFDASIEQWATPLAHGARLLIRGAELWSVERTFELLREHRVSVLDVPPAYLRELAEHALGRRELLPLRL
ncbi:MAG TPA: condensation domain-containing protein, partial [Polyangiales bacterium]|nr:condensation domain-containing protein [Polyangiales bacterium]